MLDERLDRAAARQFIRAVEEGQRAKHKQRSGQAGVPAHLFDLILNAEQLDSERISDLIVNAAQSAGLIQRGYILGRCRSPAPVFRMPLRLANTGIVPPDRVALPRKSFAHPSEEMFANLLDFYRIAWEYEPRSFPIQCGPDGKALEAFTPDFYLPEFDVYIELTTMKQSLTSHARTAKCGCCGRCIPTSISRCSIRKDFENLIFKYGLAGRTGGGMSAGIAAGRGTSAVHSGADRAANPRGGRYKISQALSGAETLKLIGVLKGSVFFLTELARRHAEFR